MKAFAGIGLLIFLVVLGYWLARTSTDTESRAVDIPIAFGNVAGGQVEMHVVVGIALANVSAAKERSLKPRDWNQWMRDHFLLTDPAGKKVDLSRQNNSKVIKPHEVAQLVGTEEFFMIAKLKSGQSYTFDYVADLATGKSYRCQVVAPATAEKARQFRFELLNAGR
ncbi:MAG: hypothetical protein GX616_23235 [Planctomycetes bacterium]|nr:hypothetical protein [Planctomycetota bacterium]